MTRALNDANVILNVLFARAPHAAAHRAGCDFIVTRDPRGFRSSPVRALAPETAAAALIAR
jgi:hypothetical protein